ncbi:MAG: peptide deformylase [Bacteroidales bacterium]|nr:peptide deformylase [Bacteroidales bacterium]
MISSLISRASIIVALPLVLLACSTDPYAAKPLTAEELNLIRNGEGLMRVTTIDNEADSLLLRSKSTFFIDEDLRSEEYAILAGRMVATVTDPSQDGVGIAGPQVGILRRVVAVQRFDKEGEPFEVYPNVHIEPVGDERQIGSEGCLSVPDMRGEVERYSKIRLMYTDPVSLEPVEELVEGFTAVIFQHECDHLDGILYIDRILE